MVSPRLIQRVDSVGTSSEGLAGKGSDPQVPVVVHRSQFQEALH